MSLKRVFSYSFFEFGKDTATAGDLKGVNLFFIHRYSYLKAKLKDT
jgi:hypothetical protein